MATHIISVEPVGSSDSAEPVVSEFSPHFGKTLVGYASGRVEARGPNSIYPDVSFSRPSGMPTVIVSNPLYDVVAIGWSDGCVSLWAGEQDQCYESPNYNEENMFGSDVVSTMTWASNGTMLVSGTTTGIVIAWDLQISRIGYTLQPVGSFKRRGAVTHIVLRTQPGGAWGRSTLGNPVGTLPFLQTFDNPSNNRGAMEFFVAYSTGSLVRACDLDDFQPVVVKSLGTPLCGFFYIPLNDSLVAVTEIGVMHIFKFESRARCAKLTEETKAQLELEIGSANDLDDNDNDNNNNNNNNGNMGVGDDEVDGNNGNGFEEDDENDDENNNFIGRIRRNNTHGSNESNRNSNNYKSSNPMTTNSILQQTRLQCIQLWCDSLAIINTGSSSSSSSQSTQIKIWNVETLSTDILKIPIKDNDVVPRSRNDKKGNNNTSNSNNDDGNGIMSISFNPGTGILFAVSKKAGYFWKPSLKNVDLMEEKYKSNYITGENLQWNLVNVIELNTSSSSNTQNSNDRKGSQTSQQNDNDGNHFYYISNLTTSSTDVSEMYKSCKFYWFLSKYDYNPLQPGANYQMNSNRNSELALETKIFVISLDQPSISYSMSVQSANIKGLLSQQQTLQQQQQQQIQSQGVGIGNGNGLDNSNINMNPYMPFNLTPSKCVYQISHNVILILTNIATAPYTLTRTSTDEMNQLYGNNFGNNNSSFRFIPNMYLYSTNDCNIYQTSCCCPSGDDDTLVLPNKFADSTSLALAGANGTSLNTTMKITTPFSIKGTDISGKYILVYGTYTLNVYELVKNDLNDNGVSAHNIKPVTSIRWAYIHKALLIDDCIVLIDDCYISRLAINGQTMEKIKFNANPQENNNNNNSSNNRNNGQENIPFGNANRSGVMDRNKSPNRSNVEGSMINGSGVYNYKQEKMIRVTTVSACVLQLPTFTPTQAQQFSVIEHNIGTMTSGGAGAGGGSSVSGKGDSIGSGNSGLSGGAMTIPTPILIVGFDNGLVKYITVTKKQLKTKNIFVGNVINKVIQAKFRYNNNNNNNNDSSSGYENSRQSTMNKKENTKSKDNLFDDQSMFNTLTGEGDYTDTEDRESSYFSYANNSAVLSNGDLLLTLCAITNYQKTPLPTCYMVHIPYETIELNMRDDGNSDSDKKEKEKEKDMNDGKESDKSQLSLAINDGFNILCLNSIPVSLSVSRDQHLKVGNFIASQMTSLLTINEGKQIPGLSKLINVNSMSSDIADLVLITFINSRRPLEPIYIQRTVYIFNDYYKDYVFNNENLQKNSALNGQSRGKNGLGSSKIRQTNTFKIEPNSKNILIPFSNLPLPNDVALDSSISCQCVLVVNYGTGTDKFTSDAFSSRNLSPIIIGLNKLISNTNYYNLDLLHKGSSYGSLLDVASINGNSREQGLSHIIPQYIQTTASEQILLIYKYIMTGRIDHAYSSIVNGGGSIGSATNLSGRSGLLGSTVSGDSNSLQNMNSFSSLGLGIESSTIFDNIAPNNTVDAYFANSTYIQLIKALLSNRNLINSSSNNNNNNNNNTNNNDNNNINGSNDDGSDGGVDSISSTNVNLLLTCIYSMRNSIYNIILRGNNAIGKSNTFDSTSPISTRNNLINIADLLFGSVDNIIDRCNLASSAQLSLNKAEFSAESNANNFLSSTQNVLSNAGLYTYAQRIHTSRMKDFSSNNYKRVLMNKITDNSSNSSSYMDSRPSETSNLKLNEEIIRIYREDPNMAIDLINQNLASNASIVNLASNIRDGVERSDGLNIEKQNISTSFTLARLLLKDRQYVLASELLMNIGYLTMALKAAISSSNDDLVLKIAKACIAKWQEAAAKDNDDTNENGDTGTNSTATINGDDSFLAFGNGSDSSRDNYKKNVILAANYFSNKYMKGTSELGLDDVINEEENSTMSSSNQLLIALMLFRQVGEVELALSVCYQTGYIDGIIYVIEGEKANSSANNNNRNNSNNSNNTANTANTTTTNNNKDSLDFMRHITPSLLSKIGIRLTEEGEKIENAINNEMNSGVYVSSTYNADSYYTSALLCFTNGCLYKEAIVLLQSHGHSINISSQLISTLVVPREQTSNMPQELRKMSKPDYNKYRMQTLNRIAELLSQLNQHAAAAKMYVQAGDKLGAIQELIRGGNTKGVVTFASASGDPNIYIVAGNYLQNAWNNLRLSGNTKEAEVILQKLTQFYVKARGYDHLIRFHFNNAIAMISDQRNYSDAKLQLDECIKIYQKFEKQLASSASASDLPTIEVIQRQLALIDLYNTLDNVADTTPDEMPSSCMLLINTLREEDSIVRICDVYGKLIIFYYIREDKNSCADVFQTLLQDGLQPTDCVDPQIVDDVMGGVQYDMAVEDVEMSD